MSRWIGPSSGSCYITVNKSENKLEKEAGKVVTSYDTSLAISPIPKSSFNFVTWSLAKLSVGSTTMEI